jgi:hypothetical protein
MANHGNLFAGLPLVPLAEETVAELLTAPNLRIERIISVGQASPPDHWYDQEWDEWVILLRGGPRLPFEGEAEARFLGPGDYVHIGLIADTASCGLIRNRPRFGSRSITADASKLASEHGLSTITTNTTRHLFQPPTQHRRQPSMRSPIEKRA